MDFKKLWSRYKQFGGFRLVWDYAKVGALWPAIKAVIRCVDKRQSFKQIYPEVLRIIEPYLIERYSSIVQEFKSLSIEHKRSKVIWFCWLQGIEQAPPIVKACYNSLQRHLVQEFKVQELASPTIDATRQSSNKFGSALTAPIVQGYEIKVIDNDNWKEYVELPEYIVKKWKKSRIPAALFSDLLRLELLIKYGGAWIDGTVLCTGFNGSKVQEFKKYLDADLFLFQYTKQGSVPVSISNWFITACSNNEVLMVLRDMLYAYWKDYDCTLDYYIFHLFFSILSKKYPEQIKAMPYGKSVNSLMLLHHWEENYNKNKWDRLVANVSFHKLAFRVSKDVQKNKNNYYNHILSDYGRI